MKYDIGNVLLSWEVRPQPVKKLRRRTRIILLVFLAVVYYFVSFSLFKERFSNPAIIILNFTFFLVIFWVVFVTFYRPKYQYIIGEKGIYLKHYLKKFYKWENLAFFMSGASEFTYGRGFIPLTRTKEKHFVIRKRGRWWDTFSLSPGIFDLFVGSNYAREVEKILTLHLKPTNEIRANRSLGFMILIFILVFLIGFFCIRF